MSTLDDRIADLYQQPLESFIAARAELAKSLSGDEAKRVRSLPKPTVVPWAVNQVFWRARPVFDAVVKSGERLRKAQIAALEGRSADVRAASEAHRAAIADAVKNAQTLAASAGSKPGPDALMRTFEALSLAPARAEAPGRLTRPLQPAGFEALGGVKVKGKAPPAQESSRRAGAESATRLSKQQQLKHELARRKEEAARKKREAAVKTAEAALERAKRRVAAAEAQLRQTRDQEP